MTRRWWGPVLCCLAIVMLWSLVEPVSAGALDGNTLQKGRSLNEVVQEFGQPVTLEWVSYRGQAVLVLFYDAEGRDVLIRGDGRRLLPLAFITEQLAGWGKSFYLQLKAP